MRKTEGRTATHSDGFVVVVGVGGVDVRCWVLGRLSFRWLRDGLWELQNANVRAKGLRVTVHAY